MVKVKKTLSILWKIVKVLFLVLFIFLGSLFFREQRLPTSWFNGLSDRLATTNIVFQCDDLAFGFRHGLRVSGIRVYDRTRKDFLTPMISVRTLLISPLSRKVLVVEPQVLRLHDGYYETNNYRERSRRLELTFPKIPTFHLTIDRPNILGLTPQRVTTRVKVQSTCLDFSEIHFDWPDGAHQTNLDGVFCFDLVKQRATGEVHGESSQSRIRPLLVALDIPSSLSYMDAFTEVTKPVLARGTFDVDLTNNDFRMHLDLKPTMGRYNGVPMSHAEGTLDLYTFVRGTNFNIKLDVDLPVARDPDGQKLAGHLTMNMSNDLVRLAYDVTSELAFRDALEIADFMDPETLDVVVCETKPVVTVKGRSGVSAADAGYNNLTFTAKLARGSFMDLQLRDLETEFSLVGEQMNFSKIEARGKKGGRYKGTATVIFPGYDERRLTFATRIDCREGSLEELADVANFELGDISGKIDGWCELSGPAQTNSVSKWNGKGSIKISDGHLAQLKLFAGLTKILAEKVPGVGFLVNQSSASADFTIKNGVFYSDNILIEGGFISLKAGGTYDIERDDANFTVLVQFLKKDSVLGNVLHSVTWPFSKLLLEFKATGSLDNPQWEYISILDRIL